MTGHYDFHHTDVKSSSVTCERTIRPGVHTCSRYSSSGNMFSVHTISSSMNDVLKRIVPARTVPAGTWSNHVLGTNRPLSTHPKQV